MYFDFLSYFRILMQPNLSNEQIIVNSNNLNIASKLSNNLCFQQYLSITIGINSFIQCQVFISKLLQNILQYFSIFNVQGCVGRVSNIM